MNYQHRYVDGSQVPLPVGRGSCHHEVELAVLIGQELRQGMPRPLAVRWPAMPSPWT